MADIIPYLINLTDIAPHHDHLVGGKAAALARLMRANFEVPSGFCVTTRAYEEFYNSNLPHHLIDQIVKHSTSINDSGLAVRSSSVAEDTVTRSWAGQFLSRLHVEPTGVVDAILDCWRSNKSAHANAYAVESGQSNKRPMAVIVQKMIESEIAGVMFTANPVSANREEIVIEAVRGLGESLAQGEVTPDNYVIGLDNSVLSYSAGSLELKRQDPILAEQALINLANLGRRIENYFGTPQDIEWAIAHDTIYILQSRPITTLE